MCSVVSSHLWNVLVPSTSGYNPRFIFYWLRNLKIFTLFKYHFYSTCFFNYFFFSEQRYNFINEEITNAWKFSITNEKETLPNKRVLAVSPHRLKKNPSPYYYPPPKKTQHKQKKGEKPLFNKKRNAKSVQSCLWHHSMYKENETNWSQIEDTEP